MRELSGALKLPVLVALAVLFTSAGCRTPTPISPANVSEPGWTLRQGQAVWRTSADAPEFAGEIIFAMQPDGRTVLQFAKNPIPFVNVQTSNRLWQIEFVPRRKKFSGKGTPTPRLIWVHLARALAGDKTQSPLRLGHDSSGDFTFENRSSGEKISGFLQ